MYLRLPHEPLSNCFPEKISEVAFLSQAVFFHMLEEWGRNEDHEQVNPSNLPAFPPIHGFECVQAVKR